MKFSEVESQQHYPPAAVLMVTAFAALIMLLASLPASAQELPDFAGLVKQQGPAVVNIQAIGSEQRTSAVPQLPDDQQVPEFFRRFFEQFPERFEAPPGPRMAPSQGSGFIVSEDGYILTNEHVVRGASEITVRLTDRREFKASLVGADPRTDVAVIKIDGESLPTVDLGDSSSIEVGQWVLAIGTPFGFEQSASQGIVSALARSLPNDNYVPFIQTDVAVNPGNSGGPLFNTEGEVVGINSQIYTRSGGYMGLSFAIPINLAMEIAEQLKDHGSVTRGYLGVYIQDMDQSLAQSFGLSKPQGALVTQVSPDSPAAEAGLKTGDIVMKFNSVEIDRSSELPPAVGRTPVGRDVPMEILRDGQRQTLSIQVGELPEDRVASAPAHRSPSNRLGALVTELDSEERERLGLDERGVKVEKLDPEGAAAAAGIRNGDVILKFGNNDISSRKQLAKLASDSPSEQPIAVLIQRNGRTQFITITMPKA